MGMPPSAVRDIWVMLHTQINLKVSIEVKTETGSIIDDIPFEHGGLPMSFLSLGCPPDFFCWTSGDEGTIHLTL